MSETLRLGEIRTVDAAKHIQERSDAETEGFELPLNDISLAVQAVRARDSADFDISLTAPDVPGVNQSFSIRSHDTSRPASDTGSWTKAAPMSNLP